VTVGNDLGDSDYAIRTDLAGGLAFPTDFFFIHKYMRLPCTAISNEKKYIRICMQLRFVNRKELN
jgi:hypothetical protein